MLPWLLMLERRRTLSWQFYACSGLELTYRRTLAIYVGKPAAFRLAMRFHALVRRQCLLPSQPIRKRPVRFRPKICRSAMRHLSAVEGTSATS